MCSTFTMHPISIYIYINMYMCVYMYRYKVTFHHMAGSFPHFRPPHPVLPGTWSSARWRGEGTADWAQWGGGGREGSEGSGGTRATEISNMPWFDMICLYNICVLFLIVSCVSLNRYTYIFWSRYILSCILKVLCTKQTTYLYTLPIHCFQLICLPMFWLFVKICSILHAVIQIDIVRKRGFARRTKSQVWLGNVRWWYTQGSRLWSHFNEPIRTSCG